MSGIEQQESRMSNLEPLISIITPAYNAETTIVATIESVLNQTWKNWEMIIIDDGSTDNTHQTAASVHHPGIRLLQEKNKGVAATRNQGMKLAKGEYIAFLDSDDLWEPEKLASQIAFFQQADSSYGLVHSSYLEFDEQGSYAPKPLQHCKNLNISGEVHTDLIIHDFIATLTVMIKREVVENIGDFDLNFSGTEDWDLWIRIAEKYKVGYIDRSLARYRLNASGLSKNYTSFEGELKKVLDKYLTPSNVNPKQKRLALWLFHRHMTHGFARSGDFKRSLRHLLKTIQSRPVEWKNSLSLAFILYQRLFKQRKRK